MNRLRDAISGLGDLVFPLRCAGCGASGTGWCPACDRELGVLRRVERPLLADGPPLYALGRYRGAARRGVLAYKESGRRDLAEPFGRAFATGLRQLGGDEVRSWWLVPAPSRRVVSRRRGGAHLVRAGQRAVHALAAAGSAAEVADCLAFGRGVRDSAGLDPAERVRNLFGRVLVRTGSPPPRTASVALIDDVLTTGATAAACSQALAGAGARVDAVLVLTATAG